MKNLFLLLFIAIATNVAAQHNDYLITMDGIGPIKIDMTQEELEKVLQKKVPLTNPWDTISGSWQDSAKIKYKNMEVKIDFQRTYITDSTFNMRIIGIHTGSIVCKTKTGIGIGDDKLKIIMAYENDLLIMAPDFEGDTYNRSKTRYSITVRDLEKRREIVFYLKNKKVVSIESATYFNDSE